jgi:hypothetical protein
VIGVETSLVQLGWRHRWLSDDDHDEDNGRVMPMMKPFEGQSAVLVAIMYLTCPQSLRSGSYDT